MNVYEFICAAVCDSAAEVQQCAAVRVRQCVYGSAAVCGCAAVCAWQCVRLSCTEVCCRMWQCLPVRAAVCGSALYVFIYAHIRSQYS
jgi:hypothetical protein